MKSQQTAKQLIIPKSASGNASQRTAKRPETPVQELGPLLAGARALLKESSPSDDLFVHGRDVANLLLRWGADDIVGAAALLHEIVYQGHASIAQVREACGEDVALLCAEYRNRFPVQTPQGWRGDLDSNTPPMWRLKARVTPRSSLR